MMMHEKNYYRPLVNSDRHTRKLLFLAEISPNCPHSSKALCRLPVPHPLQEQCSQLVPPDFQTRVLKCLRK